MHTSLRPAKLGSVHKLRNALRVGGHCRFCYVPLHAVGGPVEFCYVTHELRLFHISADIAYFRRQFGSLVAVRAEHII